MRRARFDVRQPLPQGPAMPRHPAVVSMSLASALRRTAGAWLVLLVALLFTVISLLRYNT